MGDFLLLVSSHITLDADFWQSAYPIKNDFLRAAESQGIPVVDDLQDLRTGHGAEQW